MLSAAQRSRSISIGELTLDASDETVEMLRLRCAALSMTVTTVSYGKVTSL